MSPIIHGHTLRHRRPSAEYRSWLNMKSRCFDVTNHNYARYGGRGITVCDAWRADFLSFLSHIGRRPSPRHTVDRINNDGNYEPGNVRWATPKEQGRNKHNNRVLTVNGVSRHILDWAAVSGLSRATIWSRLKCGYTPEAAISSQMRQRAGTVGRVTMITFNGQTRCISRWARELGIKAHVLYNRLDVLGWPPERALTEPVIPRGNPRGTRRTP